MNKLQLERDTECVILWELRAGIAQQVIEILMNEQERIYWVDSVQGTKRKCSNCSNFIDAYNRIPCGNCGASHPLAMGEDGSWHEFCATRGEASQQDEKLKLHRSIHTNGAQLYKDMCFYTSRRVRQLSWLTLSQVHMILELQDCVYKEHDEWFLNQGNEVSIQFPLKRLVHKFFGNE